MYLVHYGIKFAIFRATNPSQMKLFFTIIIGAFLCTSCYTTGSLARRVESKPMALTQQVLTGLYDNRIPGDDQNSLWNDLCLHNRKKKQNIAQGNQVYISYNGAKEITVELYQFNELLDSMTLPGKAKENYFMIRKGSHFYSLILATSLRSTKTILGNDANADLLIAQGISQSISVLDDDLEDEDAEVITAVYIRRDDHRPKSTTLENSNPK